MNWRATQDALIDAGVGPQPDEMVRLQMALDATEEEVARLQMERDKAQALAASLSTDWHHAQKLAARLRTAVVDLTTAYLEDPYVTLGELKPRILALIEALDGVRPGR